MNLTAFRFLVRPHLCAMSATLLCLFLFAARQLSAQAETDKSAKEAQSVAPASNPAPQTTEPKKTETKALNADQEAAWDENKWTPLQLALFHPVQLYSSRYSVQGFNWNLIYSKNVRVYGLDLSPTGATQSASFAGLQLTAIGLSKEMNGFQVALFGDFSKVARGFQVSAFDLSFCEKKRFSGVKILGAGPYSEINYLNGAIIAPFASFTTAMNGFQFSMAHCGSEQASGVQFAGFNSADELSGLQIGLFNSAKKMSGVQLGLLNLCHDNWLPISFFLNLGF